MRARRSATDGNFGTRKSFASRNHKLTKGAGSLSWPGSERFLAAPAPRLWPEKKLSAAASFRRLEGRRTDLMTNKSHAITISLLRIGVLAAQIAVSPSAAAQSDRKSTRLNSSHLGISYAVFCLT